MKKFILSTVILATALSFVACSNAKGKNSSTVASPGTGSTEAVDNQISREAKIQVAILLDTSSSMDGLIEQAKSRLWNIVNTLTTLKFKGKTPQLEIALYEYGNNNISEKQNYIRQITPLTNDLDLLSEMLFALTTYGGHEYCGAVIEQAVKSLEWGKGNNDMKLIYIAGNEPFTQGPVGYKTAIAQALEGDIYINTIHCGNDNYGGMDTWKEGAIKGKGKFFMIDHNARVRHYSTPYDDRIKLYNEKLNSTYIGYGAMGARKKESQVKQDANASSISSSNYTERAVSKTKKVYNNSKWDLVDKAKESEAIFEELQDSELPKELQNKTKDELKAIVAQKDKERTEINKEISELARKRQAYIDEQVKKEKDNAGDDLGKAINESVIELAMVKGYKVE